MRPLAQPDPGTLKKKHQPQRVCRVLGLRAGRPRPGGFAARLGKERKHRRAVRMRLSNRDKWAAVVFIAVFLLALAAGGWLGMHYHHHGGSSIEDQMEDME